MADLKTVELVFLLDNDEEKSWVAADVDQNTSFSFNLQASDITDPTAVKTPFSFEVSLPRTLNNDAIFSSIGIYDATLLRMNAIRRTEFRLYINNLIFQEGYFKLENVTKSAYKIRLYGGLGDYFYELSDTSHSNNSDMYLRHLDFGSGEKDEFYHQVNRNTVITSWSQNSLPDSESDLHSYFGYAMTYQGSYPNFDSDTVVSGSTQSEEATWADAGGSKVYSNPELNEHRKNTKINNVTYCGHYVSYYQRPMIRLKKLFEKILERMEERGWKTETDKTFFNSSNPYWKDVWCILPQYATDSEAGGTKLMLDYNAFRSGDVKGDFNQYGSGDQEGHNKGKSGGNKSIPFSESSKTSCNLGAAYENTSLEGGVGLSAPTDRYNATFKLSVEGILLDPTLHNNVTIYIPLYLRWVTAAGSHDNRRWKSQSTNATAAKNALHISCIASIGNFGPYDIEAAGIGNTITLDNRNSYQQNHARNHSWYNQARDSNASDTNTNNPAEYIFTDTISIPPGTFQKGEKIILQFEVWGDTRWFSNGSSNVRGMFPIFRILQDAYVSYSNDGGVGIRTDKKISYTDIMQSNETCSQFLLSYCKTFGLYFVKDPYKKTVRILTRNTYYGAQEKLDWTSKIDYNREWNEEIAKFDYKIGLMKWRDTDSKYETEYLEKYSKEYGSLRLNTGYGFSDEEKDYFSENIFSNCVIATGYDPYYMGRDPIIYKDNKTLPYLQNAAGEGTTSNFILVFRNYPASTASPAFLLADDNEYMLTYGYCWTGMSNSRTVASAYPTLRRVKYKNDEPYSLYFGSPAMVYNEDEGSGLNDTTLGDGTIYARFWATFLRDRLDKDTKKLTCYVHLSMSDIQDDLFRKFIYINNTVWVLHQITGFDPLSSNPTKVELIKVKDISNYLGQKYIAGHFTIKYPAGGAVLYDSETSKGNPVLPNFDSADRDITFTFMQDEALSERGWSIEEVEGVTISPMLSKTLQTTVSVHLTENITGRVRYYYIPVQWGNTTTIIQMAQVSAWTVTTSVTPAGTGMSHVAGGGESGTSISVEDGTSVTLTATPVFGYILSYWLINNRINNNASPVLTVSEDITAVAVMEEFYPEVILIPETMTVEAKANTYVLSVTSNTTWSVAYTADWITVSTTSGDGNGTLTVTVDENIRTSDRQAEIVLTTTYGIRDVNGTHMLTQEAAEAYITLDPEESTVDGDSSQSYTVSLESNEDWRVVLPDEYKDWVQVTPTSGTAGVTTLTVVIDPNTGTSSRTGSFRAITDHMAVATHQFIQEGLAPELSIHPSGITIDATGDGFELTIRANVPWKITTSEEWLSCDPVAGTGDQAVVVTTNDNLFAERQAIITVIATDDSGLTDICEVSQAEML